MGKRRNVTKKGITIMEQYQSVIQKINWLLRGWSFDLSREKDVQKQIFEILSEHFEIQDEYRLSKKNIVDFMINKEIALEVKVKGSKTEIFRQLKRYCEFDQVKCLLLLTGRSMGLPPEINGKPVYYMSLSRMML